MTEVGRVHRGSPLGAGVRTPESPTGGMTDADRQSIDVVLAASGATKAASVPKVAAVRGSRASIASWRRGLHRSASLTSPAGDASDGAPTGDGGCLPSIVARRTAIARQIARDA
jgi:hypothetical protein